MGGLFEGAGVRWAGVRVSAHFFSLLPLGCVCCDVVSCVRVCD